MDDEVNRLNDPSSRRIFKNLSPIEFFHHDAYHRLADAEDRDSNFPLHRLEPMNPSHYEPYSEAPTTNRSEHATQSSIPRVPVGSNDRILEASASEMDTETPSCDALETYATISYAPSRTCTSSQTGLNEEELWDDKVLQQAQDHPPPYCSSTGEIQSKRTRWLYALLMISSLYSTVLSGVWLVIAIIQPRWGHNISSSRGLSPSIATTITALLAKTIELTSITIFAACLGQILTRRSLIRNSKGITLGEMTMRNWVFHPGTLITHAETVPKAGATLLGVLTLAATIAATLLTTASDAMVAPKLKYSRWEKREITGIYRKMYADAVYQYAQCASIIAQSEEEDESFGSESCVNLHFSGSSYTLLMNFFDEWTELIAGVASAPKELERRPAMTTNIFDNITTELSWTKTQQHSVEENYQEYSRIINNVSLTMPHLGVYTAARRKENHLLQPNDLAGVGGYTIHAGVVSPVLNVMCVNLDKKEISPLIYTEWPNAKTNRTWVGDQEIGWDGWEEEVPVYHDDEYLNATVVDDIFRWGEKYDRRPPVFQLLPADHNMLTNSSDYSSASIYMLGKRMDSPNYTICELSSWLSTNCSIRLDYSGTTGARLTAHYADSEDDSRYLNSFEDLDPIWSPPTEPNWEWIAQAWRLSMDLNGETYNNNASNARILTNIALVEPSLPLSTPSMAEALAVYASRTIIDAITDAPFVHYWDFPEAQPPSSGLSQSFTPL